MILIDNDSLTDKGKITALNHHNSSICSDIAVIEKKCFSVPWTERSIESQVFTEGSINVVIRDDKAENKPVGFICGQSVSDECELYRIAVLPEYRHQCIATQLMEYFINKCKNNGIKSIFLEVRCDNEPAKKLYEKHGFTEVVFRHSRYHNIAPSPACCCLVFTIFWADLERFSSSSMKRLILRMASHNLLYHILQLLFR